MNVNPYASSRVNQNLLHNWYFARPVNQRGESTYTESGYAIDRWALGSETSLTAQSGGLRLNCTSAGTGHFYSRMPIDVVPVGETITFSLLSDRGLVSVTGKAPTSGTSVSSPYASGYRLRLYNSSNNYYSACIDTDAETFSATLIAAKLELGNKQTLAHQENGEWVLNEIPDHGEELAKCQRYYQRVRQLDTGYITTAIGMASSAGTCYVLLSLPATLRARPTVKFTGDFRLTQTSYSAGKVVTAMSTNTIQQNCLMVSATSSELTPGEVYQLVGASANSDIELDANL